MSAPVTVTSYQLRVPDSEGGKVHGIFQHELELRKEENCFMFFSRQVATLATYHRTFVSLRLVLVLNFYTR